jgi:hypothetical protein
MSSTKCMDSENSLRIVWQGANAMRERAADFRMIFAAFCVHFRETTFHMQSPEK